jgi:hypothetical protein
LPLRIHFQVGDQRVEVEQIQDFGRQGSLGLVEYKGREKLAALLAISNRSPPAGLDRGSAREKITRVVADHGLTFGRAHRSELP